MSYLPSPHPEPSRRDPSDAVDLDPIAADLADAEAALARLDTGTYWTSEVSGAELPDELLAARPTTRRLPGE
jgi:RNA polymerase-binding transcription factor DksA